MESIKQKNEIPNLQDPKTKNEEINREIKRVSDRELIKVIKETKRLPMTFTRPVKLSLLVSYYNKFWNEGFTDSEPSIESDT